MCFEGVKGTLNSQILAKVNEVENKQVELGTKMDAVQDTLKKIDSRLERIDHAIYGNGEAGLKTKVATLEQQIKGMADAEAVKAGRGFEKYLTTRNAVLTMLVGAAGYLVKDVIAFIRGVLS